MSATLLDGRALAEELKGALRVRSDALAARGVQPRLAVVLAGDDASSLAYVRGIRRVAERVGVDVTLEQLSAQTNNGELRAALQRIGAERAVHGVLLQQPLPAGLSLRAVADAIAPEKDVDCTNPLTQGLLAFERSAPFVPATPAAVMALLGRSARSVRGCDAVVVGRSSVVGLPVALLLVGADATVTVAHSKTRDLGEHLRRADVVVVAAGRPRLVTGDMLKAGSTVIDVGTNVVDGAVVGDVDFASASAVAAEITPVPGGVGPVTNAMLMRNVLDAAERAAAE